MQENTYTGEKIISLCHNDSITIILEFGEPNKNLENFAEIEVGPNSLILDLDAKPPRIILAKNILEFLIDMCLSADIFFSNHDTFFESWCEWSEENTKKKACFFKTLVEYCLCQLKMK